MINPISQINLIDGLNINPIPLEMSQSMTTTKWLMAIQAKINEVILIRNEVVNDANSYTNGKYESAIKLIDDLKKLLNNGDIIPNESIGLEKLNSEFLTQMNSVVNNMVRDLSKTVWFGLNEEGYFYSVIPNDWEQINFNTNQDGNLILEY